MFTKHDEISPAAVETAFGSWNEAIVAAGLVPQPQGGQPKAEHRRVARLAVSPVVNGDLATDDQLLDELLRLERLLRRRPSGNQIEAKGRYPVDRYKKRWGSVPRAYEALLQRERARGLR